MAPSKNCAWAKNSFHTHRESQLVTYASVSTVRTWRCRLRYAMRARRLGSGRYPISAANARIRSLVCSGRLGWLRSASETVVTCTPARLATCAIVTSSFMGRPPP